MKTLSRRTALAVVPVLAATPLLASVPSTDDRFKISPEIARLVNLRKAELATGRRLSAKVEALSKAMEARGIENPFLKLNGGVEDAKFQQAMEAYRTTCKTQPEDAQAHVLEQQSNVHYMRAWNYTDEMCAITPKTWGDLLAQLETFMDDDDTEGEVFSRLLENIRRLANGAVS